MDGEATMNEIVLGGPDLSELDVIIIIRRDLDRNISVFVGDYQMQNVSSVEQKHILHLKDGTDVNLSVEKYSIPLYL